MSFRPVVYLFHGDDEPAIHGEIEKLKAKVGDPGVLEMNLTRLDGRYLVFEDLVTACSAMPFLAERRLVLLDHPLAYAKDEALRKKFIDFLNGVPPSTALVLIEHQPFSDLLTKDEKKNQKKHWLEAWAEAAEGRAYLKKKMMLDGSGGVTSWIQQRARRHGGEFSGGAAARLAESSTRDASTLDQEIQKLLAYVGWERPVEVQDVDRLAVVIPEKDIFSLVDALGNRDGRSAVMMFHRLLEEQEVNSIFPMIVRQFRLLLLCRELFEAGVNDVEAARVLEIHPYVTRKVYAQARQFNLPQLDVVYHRLLAIEAAWKLGDMDPALNLDVWIADLTT